MTDITIETHGLDTESKIFFYEQDFYVFSNFSAFRLLWRTSDFDTSEHVYHWEKFEGEPLIQHEIMIAPSAHFVFKLAEQHRNCRRKDWDEIRVPTMRRILRTKVMQHEYVYRKLMDSGDRELIENSWRDNFWGWGPNRDGQNMLGKLWMDIREELRGNNGRTTRTA